MFNEIFTVLSGGVATEVTHAELASIDWTSIILACITLVGTMFAAFMALQAAKTSKTNSIMLKTNSGKTIGQHIEQLQEDQMVLRNELQLIAQEKLKADAVLAAASLAAIAKLTLAADIHTIETANKAANELLVEADGVSIALEKTKAKRHPVTVNKMPDE